MQVVCNMYVVILSLLDFFLSGTTIYGKVCNEFPKEDRGVWVIHGHSS